MVMEKNRLNSSCVNLKDDQREKRCAPSISPTIVMQGALRLFGLRKESQILLRIK